MKKDEKFAVHLTNYGATIMKLFSMDGEGSLGDIVLGLDSAEEYFETSNPGFFGATIGRCCNRIAGGRFQIDGQQYQVTVNKPPNSLHGGARGFGNRIWNHRVTDDGIEFSYVSQDGEEGYPGELRATVRYSIVQSVEKNDDGKELEPKYGLAIEYEAVSSKPTVVNFTNHSYFNLKGHASGTVLDHEVQINSKGYTPVDDNLIPTGEIASVEGTPLDFQMRKKIQKDIGELIPKTRGYDHNMVLDRKTSHGLECAAVIRSPTSRRVFEVFTTQPGMQFYTGNWVAARVDSFNGSKTKNKVKYQDYSGFCVETQKYPDSINHQSFPSVILRPGEVYTQRTVWLFSRY
eukprot:TRINITY_DN10023_c0_g1_i4.p1 TRINITY_DN10023_c0_g1~~TRINITY_DN10023_c0_g1_i4.p1  ORF type:complete len:347 (-),score=90.23 TRINITY_DN10023_c0_g1_i4:39-1079(-)